jgi:DNA-3-methyladenine glycosylase I
MAKKRCAWAGNDPIYQKYHDQEWGKPVRNDRKLFEFLTLEGAQAGLSWITVLKKRENYRKALDDFDPKKIARYTSKKQKTLLKNPGIIRNRLKIASTVDNAKAFLKVQEEFGSFSDYLWQFVNGKPKVNRFRSPKELPAKTPQSDVMSQDLKERGFRFVGSTICYALMQAVGMVNDHLTWCFRYREISRTNPGATGSRRDNRQRSAK